VNVHLNADLPNVNDVPTLHAFDYITLLEYCRLARLDYTVTLERLTESTITFGGGCGEMTFVAAHHLSQELGVETPAPLFLRGWTPVWLG
jgi:hypothetical protein